MIKNPDFLHIVEAILRAKQVPFPKLPKTVMH